MSLFLVAAVASPAIACRPLSKPQFSCLPQGTQLADIVSATMVSSGPKGVVIKKVNVQQTLTQLKARCDRNKLVDAKGREIRFVAIPYTACGGAAPTPEMIKELQQFNAELEKLKAKYTVIAMTCNPGGIPYP